MALPSTREIELETLLRKRDAQLLELTDEVTRLRQYLSTQPAPSSTDPISLPPALVSVLTPYITRAQALADTKPSGATGGSNTSNVGSGNTALAALTQRTKLLQNENDELYELLRKSETGKLKEEVKGLRRVVNKLEGALRESHNVIISLSTELEKSHEAFASTRNSYPHSGRPRSRPPPVSANQSSNGTNAGGVGKPLPTEPRAYKKPRLSISDGQGPGRQQQLSLSPARSTMSSSVPPQPPIIRQSVNHTSGVNAIPLKRRNADSRDRDAMEVDYEQPRSAPSSKSQYGGGLKREDEDEARKRPRVGDDRGERDRDRPRHRDREWDKDKDRDRERSKDARDRDRDKDRDRDRDRDRRRNGPGGPGAGRRAPTRREKGGSPYGNGDRTLAQRMGL
ncbi:hypothetical protein NEOLEDRAFT_1155262 [Neolentinus lepideus HHB14362 ss-1]|uniref:Uncharacterized protein n=1 Tax=Neolentinus lepideus HHB14362 ss-1 TaxID=1314782 RepID=A0A165TLY4_9AGAM|nr:hypothetical protein NEOLEDRAFT_1155262 [Neolentinus lepideus HHB14362 ss-1]